MPSSVTYSVSEMLRNDHLYVKKRTNKKTGTIYWYCQQWRKGCEARTIEKGEVYVDKNEHTCKTTIPNQEVDVRRDMRIALEREAMSRIDSMPTLVWEDVMAEMRKLHGKHLTIIPKTQGISIVKTVRARAGGGDAIRALEENALRCLAPDDKRPFLIKNSAKTTATGEIERILLFGHPELVRLLRYRGCNVYIDGTFKMAPPGFSQCLIIMVHDPSVDLYVPVTYALVNRKNQDTYWSVLNSVIVATDRMLEPATVTCDFEQALINAVVEQFPKVTVIGCLFHFKQAMRRKLIDLGIPTDKVSEIMQKNKLDLLTTIPSADIEKGISFVRSVTDESGAKHKWNQFWQYFRCTWMGRYDVSMWNVSAMAEHDIPIQNRTNNPLEKYNRDFGERFKRARPSLATFVQTAKADSIRYAQLIEDIKKGHAEPPSHAQEVEIVISQEFPDFQ